MKDNRKIGIVVLNYNGWKDTLNCIDSLKYIESKGIIKIVVDNASTDDSYIQLKANLPADVLLVQSGKNLGYAGGNNIGIKIALEKNCDYICILNNDTLAESDFLTPCVNELEKNADIGFIGPVILDYKNRTIQSSGANINSWTGANTCINAGKKYEKMPAVINCDYVGGACLIFRSTIVDKIGLIPECYFLFFEETEWCLKAKKAGYSVICYMDSYILHKGAVSIRKIGGLNDYLYYRNLAAFIKRNTENPLKRIYCYERICGKEALNYILTRKDIHKQRISALKDGWANRFDLKRFPFITARDNS